MTAVKILAVLFSRDSLTAFSRRYFLDKIFIEMVPNRFLLKGVLKFVGLVPKEKILYQQLEKSLDQRDTILHSFTILGRNYPS